MAVWSEVVYSQAREGNRFDAEYYSPDNLSLLAALREAHPKSLVEFAFVTDGIHASPDVVEEEGVRYLSAKCVRDNDFALSDTLYISTEQDAANRRTQLRAGDVLITTVGTIGNAAVVQTDFLPANADRHLGIIRLKPDSDVDPYFLASFLNARYGRFQTLREATGNVQLNLFIEKIKRLLVPLLGCREIVAGVTLRAYHKRRESERLYEEAEKSLNVVLGLGSLDLSPRPYYEARYADTSSASRMDAEYFQPAKRVVLDALSRISRQSVVDRFRSVRKPWQPDRAKAGDRVRNYDVTDALSIFLDDTLEPEAAEEIGSTKKLLAPGDVVISRLRSYLKEIALVLPGGDTPLVGSSEFVVLRPRQTEFPAEALLVYLRSPYVQTILRWCQDGSNHPRFPERELLAIPIPDKLMKLGTGLAAKVHDAIAARQESRRLLNIAKRAIELAVEEGEAAALGLLNQEQG